MEKHCERQHRTIPPGGRGNYLSSSEPLASENQQATSPFQQVRTYPVPTGNKFISTSTDLQSQPNVLYPASR